MATDGFYPKNILALSSPVRRVIESNLAVLSGLLPPTPEWIWSNMTELARLWQPIAVQTDSPTTAFMLGEDAPCPEADAMSDQIDSLPSVINLFDRYSKLLEELRHETEDELKMLKDVGGLYDTVFCEQNYFGSNFIMPKWLNASTLAALKQFREMQFSVYGELHERFLRLKAGPFLKQLLQNINKLAKHDDYDDDDDNQYKVFTYSTHDKILSIILHSFGLFVGK